MNPRRNPGGVSRRAAMLKLKEQLQKRTAPKLVPADPPPIYDAVFEAGVRWLDRGDA